MSDRDDERVQPALHALLSGDVDGLRAALEADPGAVNLRVGDDASVTIEDANHGSDASGWAQACDDGSEAATSVRALVGGARTG